MVFICDFAFHNFVGISNKNRTFTPTSNEYVAINL